VQVDCIHYINFNLLTCVVYLLKLFFILDFKILNSLNAIKKFKSYFEKENLKCKKYIPIKNSKHNVKILEKNF